MKIMVHLTTLLVLEYVTFLLMLVSHLGFSFIAILELFAVI